MRTRPTGPGLLTPLQRMDLLVILARTVNERRVPVIAAWLGLRIDQLYDGFGLTRSIRHAYQHKARSRRGWVDRHALLAAFDLARYLGLDPSELWEMDDGWDPVACLPLKLPIIKASLTEAQRQERRQRLARAPRLAIVKAG